MSLLSAIGSTTWWILKQLGEGMLGATAVLWLGGLLSFAWLTVWTLDGYIWFKVLIFVVYYIPLIMLLVGKTYIFYTESKYVGWEEE